MEIFSSHMKSNTGYDLIAIPRMIYRLVTIKGVLLHVCDDGGLKILSHEQAEIYRKQGWQAADLHVHSLLARCNSRQIYASCGSIPPG